MQWHGALQEEQEALAPPRDDDSDFLTTDKLVAETFYNLFPDAFSEIMPIRKHKVRLLQSGCQREFTVNLVVIWHRLNCRVKILRCRSGASRAC